MSKNHLIIHNISSWIVVLFALLFSVFIVYSANQEDPHIDEIFVYDKLLHGVKQVDDQPVFEEKRIIRPGSKVSVYREYTMTGDFNNGAHFSWIESIDSSYVYKFPMHPIIGVHGKVLKIPLWYRLPRDIPIGKYSLNLRIFGKTNPFNSYQQDLTPVYFEIK